MNGVKKFDTEGLNSLKYKIKYLEHKILYTWILVDIRQDSVSEIYSIAARCTLYTKTQHAYIRILARNPLCCYYYFDTRRTKKPLTVYTTYKLLPIKSFLIEWNSHSTFFFSFSLAFISSVCLRVYRDTLCLSTCRQSTTFHAIYTFTTLYIAHNHCCISD